MKSFIFDTETLGKSPDGVILDISCLVVDLDQVENPPKFMDLVKAGFGIGYATKEFIQDELKNNLLYEIKVTPKVPKRFIGIATIDKKTPNYSVKKFVEMMTNDI